MAAGQMFVDMKMNITTCGAHSGLIVHSGVHQGKADATLLWPYSKNVQPTTSIPFLNAALPVQQQQQQSQQQSLPWRKESSRPASCIYSFRGTDSPPSEFIEPDNVQLNVFNVDPVNYSDYKPKTLESEKKPVVEHRPTTFIDDAVTTTTTLEVFRTKVDSNNPNEHITLPPVPAPGMEGRQQVLRAIGPDYEKRTNSRTGTLTDEPIKWGDHNGLRNSAEALPHDENCASTAAFVGRHAYASGVSSSALNNEQTRIHSPLNGNRNQMETANRQKAENIYEVARSRSVEDVRDQYAPDYLYQRSRPQDKVPTYEAPTISSSRRSRGIRTSATSNVAKSEEIFHLYETRDAYGNIHAKCETAVDLRNQQIPTSANFTFTDDSIAAQTTRISSIPKSGVVGERITTVQPHSVEAKEYTSSTEDSLVPYYSIKNATRTTSESFTYPRRKRYSETPNAQVPTFDYRSAYESQKLCDMHGASKIDPIKITTTRSQPSVYPENDSVISRVDEIHVNSTNTTAPLRSEKYTCFANSTYLKPSGGSVRLHPKLYGHESRRTTLTSEAVSSWPAVPPEVPEFSALKIQKEEASMQVETLGNGDPPYRKKNDVTGPLNKLSQSEAEYAELSCPTYEEFATLKSEPDSVRLVYDTTDAYKCSLEDVTHQRSSADVSDRTSLLQINESEQPSTRIGGLSMPLSKPLLIPRSPVPITTADSEASTPSTRIIIDGFVHMDDRSAISDLLHVKDCDPEARAVIVETDLSCSPLIASTIKSDYHLKRASVVPELNQQFEDLVLNSISSNQSNSLIISELEQFTSSTEEESITEENGEEIVSENIEIASNDDFLNRDDNPTSSISTADLSALPSKSILHAHCRSKRQRTHKSVSFPSREPQVIVDEHRLLITGVKSDPDSDNI